MVDTRMTFESTRALRKRIVKTYCITASLWGCHYDADNTSHSEGPRMLRKREGDGVSSSKCNQDSGNSTLDTAASGWTFGALVDRMMECGSTRWVKHRIDDEHIDPDIREKVQNTERTDGCTVGIKQTDFRPELWGIAVPTDFERRMMADKGVLPAALPESESSPSA